MNDYEKLKEQHKELLKEFKQLSRDYSLSCQMIRTLKNQIKILTSKDLTGRQKKSLLTIGGTGIGGKINARTN